ncbi:MAG TPA: class I SAM-dependent methyltransferase [bacterium]
MNAREYRAMFEAEDRHWWYVGLHELVVAIVGRLAAGRREPLRILDAGCGTGRLMQLLGRAGAVEGFDVSPEAVDFCRRRGLERVRVADLNAPALPECAYDVITVIDVLYHRGVRDEAAALGSLRAALAPGGVLIRNDPAFEALRSDHDRAVHTRERYRPPRVRQLLLAAGLEPEIVTYRVAAAAPAIALHRLARRWGRAVAETDVRSDVKLPGAGLNRALLALLRAENRLIARTGLPFGTSVFAVARRPAVSGT